MKYNLYIMKTSTWTPACILLLASVFMHATHHTSIMMRLGSDQNNGTSLSSTWQSIEALKQISLQPVITNSSQKRGGSQIWKSQAKVPTLTPSLSMHAVEAIKAILQWYLHVCRTYFNSDYFTIQNLEISDPGKERKADIWIKSKMYSYGICCITSE